LPREAKFSNGKSSSERRKEVSSETQRSNPLSFPFSVVLQEQVEKEDGGTKLERNRIAERNKIKPYLLM
jgi:hypothetical protein